MLAEVVRLVQDARRIAARSVNSVMTTAYWEIGCRIVEHEQGGAERAAHGEALLARLSVDLTNRFGRGFSVDRLETSRLFYLAYSAPSISATALRKSRAVNSAIESRISPGLPAAGENPPVGLILCTSKEDAVARYALEGLPSKVLAAEYLTALPKEQLIADTLSRTRQQLEARASRTVRPPRLRK